MIKLFIFIIGVALGSFINALVYRLHHKLNFISARSHCPLCQHNLVWYELIPIVSFIFLRGRCRRCNKKISWQYPIVEIICGTLFLLIYQTQVLSSQTILPPNFVEVVYISGFYVLTIFLVIIFLYDLKYYLILDIITFPAMLVAVLWQMIVDFSLTNFINILLAATVGGGFFLLQFLVSKGKWIGGGDIRLGALLGFILGWPDILAGLMLAYVIGAIFSLGMVLLKKKRWGAQIPFGTFLTIGAFIALLWGDKIIRWYLGRL